MPRNKAQFQKGFSLNEFIKQYGTEDQCFDALYNWRWPTGLRCPKYSHTKCCQLSSRKLQQCNRCRHQTSRTAVTIFESTKLPLMLAACMTKSCMEEKELLLKKLNFIGSILSLVI